MQICLSLVLSKLKLTKEWKHQFCLVKEVPSYLLELM